MMKSAAEPKRAGIFCGLEKPICNGFDYFEADLAHKRKFYFMRTNNQVWHLKCPNHYYKYDCACKIQERSPIFHNGHVVTQGIYAQQKLSRVVSLIQMQKY